MKSPLTAARSGVFRFQEPPFQKTRSVRNCPVAAAIVQRGSARSGAVSKRTVKQLLAGFAHCPASRQHGMDFSQLGPGRAAPHLVAPHVPVRECALRRPPTPGPVGVGIRSPWRSRLGDTLSWCAGEQPSTSESWCIYHSTRRGEVACTGCGWAYGAKEVAGASVRRGLE